MYRCINRTSTCATSTQADFCRAILTMFALIVAAAAAGYAQGVTEYRAWGDHSSGQLGPIGRTEDWYNTPILGSLAGHQGIGVDGTPTDLSDKRIIDIDGTETTTFFLLDDGTVWAAGWNGAYMDGGIGDEETNPHFTFYMGDTLHQVWGPDTDGDGIGDGALTGIEEVEGSYLGNVYALDKDTGTLYAWGSDWYGQLGDGEMNSTSPHYEIFPVEVQIDGVMQISAGSEFMAALKTDGTVWTSGGNYDGELGIGREEIENGVFVAIDVPQQVQGLDNVIEISVGYNNVLALKDDGTGNGTGTVWAWGSNWNGELGIGMTYEEVNNGNGMIAPVEVPGLSNVKSVSAGFATSFALDADGNLYGWGWNNGFSWDDQLTPVLIMTDVKYIDGGGNSYTPHAVKQDGTVWGWGQYNGYRAIGHGLDDEAETPVQVVGVSGIGFLQDVDKVIHAGPGAVFALAEGTLIDYLSIEPASPYTFPDTAVEESASRQFKLVNTSSNVGEDLQIVSIRSDSAVFPIPVETDYCAGWRLLGGTDDSLVRECTFEVSFEPQAAQDFSATIRVEVRAIGAIESQVFKVVVNGAGVPGAPPPIILSIDPASPYTFAETEVGKSTSQPFRLINGSQNTGEDFQIISINVNSSVFPIGSDSCEGRWLRSGAGGGPGAECAFEVLFSPQETRGYSATIEIEAQAAGAAGSEVFEAIVIGTGRPETIDLLEYFMSDGSTRNDMRGSEIFYTFPRAIDLGPGLPTVNGFTTIKNLTGEVYEEFSYDEEFIYHLRDTSWAVGLNQDVYCRETGNDAMFTLFDEDDREGAKWVPRRMAIGEEVTFHRDVVAVDKVTCQVCEGVHPISGATISAPNGGHTIKLVSRGPLTVTAADGTEWTLEDVIRLAITGGIGTPENFFYAKGIGWVGFDYRPGDPDGGDDFIDASIGFQRVEEVQEGTLPFDEVCRNMRPASPYANAEINSIPAVPDGGSHVAMAGDLGFDFAHNLEAGILTVTRRQGTPPHAGGIVFLDSHWSISATMPPGTFSAQVTFPYTDEQVSAAGASEQELLVWYSEDGGQTWSEATLVDHDTEADMMTVRTEHFSLWSIGQAANSPPDCTVAVPSETRLWPPNRKMRPVQVLEVADPDDDPVTLSITGITQDEPVKGRGSGNTSPDGSGVGTAIAQLRAERAGASGGRVYEVSFTAADGRGGSCAGSVRVCVPHDQGAGADCVDDGQVYDSTAP